jgi:hypothetical protein
MKRGSRIKSVAYNLVDSFTKKCNKSIDQKLSPNLRIYIDSSIWFTLDLFLLHLFPRDWSKK